MLKILRQPLLVFGVLLVAAILLCDVGHVLNIRPKAAPHVNKVISLGQQWTASQASWFHTVSQGTKIMPIAWFLALEQPDLGVLTTPRLLHEADYLQRFGFIYDDNPCPESPKLPIGFAIETNYRDPHFSADEEGRREDVVGLTCAACHTGQLNYRGTGVRIEGGPGNVDLGLFQSAVGRSLAFTLYVPWRFERFARRVLGKSHDDASEKTLKARFKTFVESKLHAQMYADGRHLYDLKGGNGRTDALALIGNRTFQDLADPENLAVTSAPVNFPPLWDAPWFDWVQYNASIAPPMVRNIGEALGVGAQVVTNPSTGVPYDSTVNVRNLHAIETALAGCQPFKGLAAPTWPEAIFGSLSQKKVRAGRRLYAQRCIKCHPLASELRESYAEDASCAWTHASGASDSRDYTGSRLIRLQTINLRHIGTDPAQVLNMHKRVVQTPEGMLSEGDALMLVTQKVRKKKYGELRLSPDQCKEYDSYRANVEQRAHVIADNLGYRPRPLDGVWATAPYLHNGSVPSLYELLLPVERRSKKFYAGGREFDPERVGLHCDKRHGVFLFDTSIPGNLNGGHEFRNLTLEEFERCDEQPDSGNGKAADCIRWAKALGLTVSEYEALSTADRRERIRAESAKRLSSGDGHHHGPPGVLGAELTDPERWALVEYLKSL